MLLEQAQALGFDLSEQGGGYVRIGCSQCEALVINDVPCHEVRCPNQHKECKWCGNVCPEAGKKFCDDSCYCAYNGLPDPMADEEMY